MHAWIEHMYLLERPTNQRNFEKTRLRNSRKSKFEKSLAHSVRFEDSYLLIR